VSNTRYRLVRPLLAVVLGVAVTTTASAWAQDTETQTRPRVELSARSWLFTNGQTTWSHDASGINPAFGDPTSKLTYKDNNTHIIEFGAKLHLSRRWHLDGDVGFAIDFDRGRLIDDDYLAGQYLFSRTSSNVTGTGTWYVNGNVGYRAVEFSNGRGHLDVVGGLRYWQTEYEATGFDRLVCDPAVVISCVPQSSTARAITNTSHWITPQVGINTDYRLTGRLSVGLKASVTPVSIIYNEDVHHQFFHVGGWIRRQCRADGQAHADSQPCDYSRLPCVVESYIYRNLGSPFGRKRRSVGASDRISNDSPRADGRSHRLVLVATNSSHRYRRGLPDGSVSSSYSKKSRLASGCRWPAWPEGMAAVLKSGTSLPLGWR